jgi:SAM-dependent methyltransferase
MSHDCNKYIINEGEYIRDFESMYAKYSDPWDQRSNNELDLSSYIAVNSIKFLINKLNYKVNRILDIGCADGYHGKSLLKLDSNVSTDYIGTDISGTVISRAKNINKLNRCKFLVDDIRVLNDAFVNKFNFIFTSKTLYYVAPEIDEVLKNIKQYILKEGFLCFVYNETKDSFSKKWLTSESLRNKLISIGFLECTHIELNRYSTEKSVIGIFRKLDKV